MSDIVPVARWKTLMIWTSVPAYLLARICQLWADHLPSLLIVFLHVLPPAIFALIHGSILYGRKGILAFTLMCLGFAGFFESLSLRTGFPFGRYYFTDLMGPKLFGLPFLLVLGYLGIGYCSWILALLILDVADRPKFGTRVVALPVLAAFTMLAWDFAMDPQWAAVDRAWVWIDGGPFFGVPVSNFFGWYLTAYCFYQAFALYTRSRSTGQSALSREFWRAPILVYAICAGGNLLIHPFTTSPAVFVDAAGRHWSTVEILRICRLLSILIMGPIALLAWLRLEATRRNAI